MIVFLACLFSIVSHLEVIASSRVDQSYNGELDFGVNLFKLLSNNHENTVISPNSVYNALLTVYLASAGETEGELTKLLGLDKISPKLDKYKLLDSILNENKNTSSLKELHVYNRIYIDKEVKVKPDKKKRFDELLAVFETEDNRADEVNKWISSKTHGFINELIEPGSLGKGDKLVFVNAEYLKKMWVVPFSGGTIGKNFTFYDGSVVQVPLMSVTGKLFQSMVSESLGAQVIKLPYQGGPMSMVIVIPTSVPNKSSSPLQELVSQLDGNKIREIMSTLQKQPFCETDLLVPTFEDYVLNLELKKVLSLMIGGEVFDKEMNLTNLLEPDQPSMTVDKVVHMAKVNVYENGTVAAAATAITPLTATQDTCHSVVHANRPFLYFIYCEALNVIHFIGTLYGPNHL